MIEDAIKLFEERIAGHMLAIELEEVILAHLQPDMDAVNKPTEGITFNLRRVNQHINSRNEIKKWKAELAAFAIALNQLKGLPQ